MIIGIDIDDTLTDIRDELKKSVIDYALSLGKQINEDVICYDKKNDSSSFQEKYNLTHDEIIYFYKNIQEDIVTRAVPRKDVVQTFKKLRELGNKIYIITARDSEFHDDPYSLSKAWLDKWGFEYDKLIVNARDKAKVCVEENVDIFIDDKLSNCMDVSNKGIKVIRITNYKEKHGDIINKSNWEEIYKYISEME